MHWIEASGLIAVIRLDDLSRAVELATALVEGGIRVLEFTYTNRQAGRSRLGRERAMDATRRTTASLRHKRRCGTRSVLSSRRI